MNLNQFSRYTSYAKNMQAAFEVAPHMSVWAVVP